MKILFVHNHYQLPGGEDEVFRGEAALLRSKGHEVLENVRTNDEIRDYGIWNRVALGLRTVWAWDSTRKMRDLLKLEKPDVAHFHNMFPLISPSAYYACAEAGVPVVQTLHNYRLLCPGALLYRDGGVCEDCLHKRVKWPGILHGCYRGSRFATAPVAAMVAVHHGLGTWRQKVNQYIALTESSRRKFIEGGLPPQRVVVKPNFVHPDPKPKNGPGSYALYVGRLSEGKGLAVLLAAWGKLQRHIPLRIAGDGPLREELAAEIEAKKLRDVEIVGQVSPSEAFTLMHGARFLVFPSEWPETFGMTIIEAFACGVPVIASRLGAMAEIITDGENGLHFGPGDAAELAEKAEWAWTHPAEIEEWGRNARVEYEAKYTAERNYQMLMDVYEGVLAGQRSDQSPSEKLATPTKGIAQMKSEEFSSADSLEASVVAANVCFYREVAPQYDRYEACASDRDLQEMLDRDLDRIGSLIQKPGKRIECLDCGAGSGNLTLKMLKRGWSVTAVDISTDMLALLETKAASQGYSLRLINDSIADFLAATDDRYDVVAFSSVLHHLCSYLPVVAQAAEHLRPNGIFYSNFDPVISQHKALASLFEAFDTSIAKIVHDPADLLPGISRRVRKVFIGRDARHDRPVLGPGDLAEYHARTGLDDMRIIELLGSKGFVVHEHVRWTTGRTAVAKFINGRLGLMKSFKIAAQRSLTV
jgi:glycosyltransferase involved in cell wall biosynthesis/2-polyprenyl-3-methyl-5-hydroxy-6-metoxy-1,4-benzoquinol methylase